VSRRSANTATFVHGRLLPPLLGGVVLPPLLNGGAAGAFVVPDLLMVSPSLV